MRLYRREMACSETRVAMIATLLTAMTGCALEQAASHGELTPRDHITALAGRCGWGDGNLVWLTHYDEQDVPVVVLDEEQISCFGSGVPRPTVAIWEDGRVEFVRRTQAGFERVQGVISRAQVRSIVDDSAAKVASLELRHDTHPEYSSTSNQTTMIIVRDGDRWRAATMDGAYEKDFRDAAAGVSRPPPAPLDTNPWAMGFPLAALPPRPYAELYVRLRDVRPASVTPFMPYAYDLEFEEIDPRGLGSEKWGDVERRSIAWPSDLPEPPADVVRGRCENGLDDGRQPCEFALDPSYNATVERYGRARLNTVRVNGTLFYLRMTEMYAGERTVSALMECAALLSKPTR